MMSTVVRAVILAAGASSRMGRPKAALPLTDGADTFLSRILRACATAGLPEVIVVTGSAADVVRAAAGRVDRRVRFVHNPTWEAGQLSSLLVGLEAPARRGPIEAVLVTLVDVPLLAATTIERVLHGWRETRALIVRPVRGDEHGHPVIFDGAVFDELRAADLHVGAKAVLRAHERQILNVAVADPGAFLDLDTNEDYRTALAQLPRTR